MTRKRASICCAVAALAAYGVALASVVWEYPHASDTACPDGAAPPGVFWPLLVVAVLSAVGAFWLRRRDVLAIFVVIVVPLASLLTIFGYAFTYACWE